MGAEKRVAEKATTRHGKFANPRRHLLASDEQFAAWDAAAERDGLTWSEWARRALDIAVGQGKTR